VNFPIDLMCEVLDVSRSGYYAWCQRPLSLRSQENQKLSQQIEEIHQASRQTYGSPRIQLALQAQGFQVGRNRVIRQMHQLGINAQVKRQFVTTTDSDHELPIAENVLNRAFTTLEPDQSWVADITYVATEEGWLYLAVILDLFSRRVIGWSLAKPTGRHKADHMRTDLVLTALESSLGQRIPSTAGLVFHSDRGGQYASHDYRAALKTAGITCSMSRRANCWDNAVAESFFGTLKTELVYRHTFQTRKEARTTIAEWIEVFYNRQRIHSSIGYVSPVQFEEDYWRTLKQSIPIPA
jgi:putative transposase